MKKGFKKEGLVYVVDNHRLYRDIIKMVLEKAGYTVRLFEDGSHVLKNLSVNKSIRVYMPDLIICELNMRVMSGLALFDEIQKCSYLKGSIPFLFTDSSGNSECIAVAEMKSGNPVFDKEILLRPLAEMAENILLNQLNQTNLSVI